MSSKKHKNVKMNVFETLRDNKVTVEEAQKAPSPSSNNVFLVDNTKGLIAGRDFPVGKYRISRVKGSGEVVLIGRLSGHEIHKLEEDIVYDFKSGERVYCQYNPDKTNEFTFKLSLISKHMKSDSVTLTGYSSYKLVGHDFPPGKYMVTSNKIGEKFSVSTGYHHDKTFEKFTTPQEYTFAHTQELITHDAETLITLTLE